MGSVLFQSCATHKKRLGALCDFEGLWLFKISFQKVGMRARPSSDQLSDVLGLWVNRKDAGSTEWNAEGSRLAGKTNVPPILVWVGGGASVPVSAGDTSLGAPLLSGRCRVSVSPSWSAQAPSETPSLLSGPPFPCITAVGCHPHSWAEVPAATSGPLPGHLVSLCHLPPPWGLGNLVWLS